MKNTTAEIMDYIAMCIRIGDPPDRILKEAIYVYSDNHTNIINYILDRDLDSSKLDLKCEISDPLMAKLIERKAPKKMSLFDLYDMGFRYLLINGSRICLIQKLDALRYETITFYIPEKRGMYSFDHISVSGTIPRYTKEFPDKNSMRNWILRHVKEKRSDLIISKEE